MGDKDSSEMSATAPPPYGETGMAITEPPKTGEPKATGTAITEPPKTDEPKEAGTAITEPPKTDEPQATVMNLFRRALGLNPGFCPGAVEMRDLYKTKAKWVGRKRKLPYKQCAHCGIRPTSIFPDAYKKDWPNYAKYRDEFAFECHIAAQRKDQDERRGCLVCWEKKGIWVEPMDVEEWGAHTRAHFKDEGYWMCVLKGDENVMTSNYSCPSRKCRGIHC